ncbi:MAG: 1-deoxy-D-xylulose-5-phosphate synthase [Lachnospiraceae bacterium]|nr:1-deoxy-D-xylulose-5-phosphate synthase [Lachnospiraceae bacterium]
MAILDKINETGDVKRIDAESMNALAQEIREFLVEKVGKNGGHLASNLGDVELTLALHRVLNLPKDKIIWDVGHQAYTHKILTGRKDKFDTLRQYGGLSGFPKKLESDCDIFDTGHGSNSLSAGLGLVRARDLAGEDYTVVSVIGDGSMTGGLAYEALNNAGKLETNYIIVLNDNNMSINENVGGMSRYLDNVRTAEGYLNLKADVYSRLKNNSPRAVSGIRKAKNSFKQLFVPGMVFENLGITYLGPVDGHDEKKLERMIMEARRVPKAVMIHVITKKGKGYEPAERHPARFHGTGPFEVATGLPRKSKSQADYTDIFSTVMCKLGARDEKIVAVTAAMADGTGLKRFRNMYPERFFDAGIAEEHAVTFSAGVALGGYKPIFAVYSSFLQRGYDQVMEDVCLQDLPVVFAIDRAGIVGADGETHQGVFDLSYLSSMPNMCVMAPKNKWELSDMMKFAVSYAHPIAVRYPRGTAYDGLSEFRAPIALGKAEVIYEEEEIALFALGNMVKVAETVRDTLKKEGHHVSLYNARFCKPIDKEAILFAGAKHRLIVTMEENVLSGGFGEKVRAFADENGVKAQVLTVAIPDRFIPHGAVDILFKEAGIDAESVVRKIKTALGNA